MTGEPPAALVTDASQPQNIEQGISKDQVGGFPGPSAAPAIPSLAFFILWLPGRYFAVLGRILRQAIHLNSPPGPGHRPCAVRPVSWNTPHSLSFRSESSAFRTPSSFDAAVCRNPGDRRRPIRPAEAHASGTRGRCATMPQTYRLFKYAYRSARSCGERVSSRPAGMSDVAISCRSAMSCASMRIV